MLAEVSPFVATGLDIFYLHSCPTLAWLWIHGQLVIPQDDEFIKSGRNLDDQRFSSKRSLDLSPYGRCDWVTGAQTNPVIHEGSRSKHHNDPKRAQLRHYLWAAKKLYGLDATGLLHLRKGRTEEVLPNHETVERDHERLQTLMEASMPAPRRLPICKGCTNRDWCWG